MYSIYRDYSLSSGVPGTTANVGGLKNSLSGFVMIERLLPDRSQVIVLHMSEVATKK